MAAIDDLNAEERARAYDLLGTVFDSAPTEETTRAVYDLALALGIHCPHGGWRPGEIQRDFMDLLVVPNPRYLAPYESVHRDGGGVRSSIPGATRVAGLLMGDSTMAVRQAFLDAGVLPSRDLPDHIANELRLVAYLWRVEGRADPLAAPDAQQQRQRFVAEHLLTWITELAGKVGQNCGTGFYSAAMEVMRAFLAAEVVPVPSDNVGDVSAVASIVAS